MTQYDKTSLNQLHRKPDRGHYDKATIHAIIDETLICHVGFIDGGQPVVIPTIHARDGDTLLLHGAKASRLLKHVAAGHPICLTFTLVDGLVLARSVFHSSMNYRSAVVFGHGRLLETAADKLHALEILTEHLAAGRWADARPPTDKELAATAVVAVDIDSASAKVRSGPPLDDEADYALPIWAGVIPLAQEARPPISDPRLPEDIPAPPYAAAYSRRAGQA